MTDVWSGRADAVRDSPPRRQGPDLPPLFSRSSILSIRTPRSRPLTMS